ARPAPSGCRRPSIRRRAAPRWRARSAAGGERPDRCQDETSRTAARGGLGSRVTLCSSAGLSQRQPPARRPVALREAALVEGRVLEAAIDLPRLRLTAQAEVPLGQRVDEPDGGAVALGAVEQRREELVGAPAVQEAVYELTEVVL